MFPTKNGVVRTRYVVMMNKNIIQVIIVLSAVCSGVLSASVDFTTSDVINHVSSDNHTHDNITDLESVNIEDTKNTITKQTGNGNVREVAVRALVLEDTSSKKNYMEDGVILVYEGNPLSLLLYGDNVDQVIRVKLTTAEAEAGGSCTSQSGHYQVN